MSEKEAPPDMTTEFIEELLTNIQPGAHEPSSYPTTTIRNVVDEYIDEVISDCVKLISSRSGQQEGGPQQENGQQQDVYLKARAKSLIGKIFVNVEEKLLSSNSNNQQDVVSSNLEDGQRTTKDVVDIDDVCDSDEDNHKQNQYILKHLGSFESPSITNNNNKKKMKNEDDLDETKVSDLESKVINLQEELMNEKVINEKVLERKLVEINEWKIKYENLNFEFLNLKENYNNNDNNIIKYEEEIKEIKKEIKKVKENSKFEMETIRKESNKLKLKYDLNVKENCHLHDKQEQLRKKLIISEQELINKSQQYDSLLHTLKEEKRKHHAASKFSLLLWY